MSPARESEIARWMGSVDARLGRLMEDMKEERSGSAEYRHEMRERMAGQDHSLADLERGLETTQETVKNLEPIVNSLNVASWKQRGAIVVLSALGSLAGAIIVAGLIKYFGFI